MDIAILHCHFERGGVTQVVENHVAALRSCAEIHRILLISGPRQNGLSAATLADIETLVIDDFDYDPETLTGRSDARAETTTARLRDALQTAGLEPESTVLHWHNHSLGKNTAAPAAIDHLASQGWRLLLQIHDFAEDNRPENYRRLITATGATTPAELDGVIYPVASQIHYATLTGGDAEVLRGIGIPIAQTHCLPNSVKQAGDGAADREASLAIVRQRMSLPDDASWCLYPVRGIRRKNVGEFLLLCRWLPENQYGGLTLRPTTPLEARSYDRWRKVAAAVSPRAVFDAAHHEGLSFARNLAASRFVFSTSVAEGFGMAFLEPWLSGRGVVARNLPNVSGDFADAGVSLTALYEQIPVPGSPDWLAQCRGRIRQAFTDAWSQVPENFRPSPESALQDLGESESGSDSLDFARLTPGDQAEVLERAARDSRFEGRMRERSEGLMRSLQSPPSEAEIAANATRVSEVYSTDAQGQQLQSIYRSLLSASLDSTPHPPPRAGTAVQHVSRVRPFYPCRTETHFDD